MEHEQEIASLKARNVQLEEVNKLLADSLSYVKSFFEQFDDLVENYQSPGRKNPMEPYGRVIEKAVSAAQALRNFEYALERAQEST